MNSLIRKAGTALLFLLILTTPVVAQQVGPQAPDEGVSQDGTLEVQREEGPVDLSNPFEISLSVGTQSPWSKKVPISVKITPKLDSSRTEVSWDVPQAIIVEEKYNDFFSVNQGESVEVIGEVESTRAGTYSITVSVTNWGYGSNFTSSESIVLAFDQSGTTVPKTVGYDVASMIRYVVILIFILILGVAAFFGARVGLKKLQKWLQPPE